MICEVRPDSWFCDLWLAKFWFGVWVFISCDMGLNFVVVGFVDLAMLDGVAFSVWRWRYRFIGTVVGLAVLDSMVVGLFNLKSSLFSHSHGFMVELILEWFTEGSQWLNFCGFFFSSSGGGWQWLVTGC